MMETKDLSSYIPGYDDYCEPKKQEPDIDDIIDDIIDMNKERGDF